MSDKNNLPVGAKRCRERRRDNDMKPANKLSACETRGVNRRH